MRMALRMLMSYCCITLLRSGSEWPFDQARAISKILFNLGSYNFLAYLECVRSYAWSKGHSDSDLSSVDRKVLLLGENILVIMKTHHYKSFIMMRHKKEGSAIKNSNL